MSGPEPAAKTEAIEAWKEPAHPSARLVGREALGALDRQLRHMDSLDTKNSYLATANVVVMAAFLGGLAAHAVRDERLQDIAGAALIVALVGLGASLYTWWPRLANAPPHPRGLREKYFNARETDALQEIADEVVFAFEQNKGIGETKLIGIRVASACLFLAVLLAVAASFVIFVLGR